MHQRMIAVTTVSELANTNNYNWILSGLIRVFLY